MMLVFHLVNLVQRGRISPQSQHYEIHMFRHTHIHIKEWEVGEEIGHASFNCPFFSTFNSATYWIPRNEVHVKY